MLVSALRRWWWRRGYQKFYTSAQHRENRYAMNAGEAARFEALVAELRSLVQPSPHDVVLDVGGGNGVLTAAVFEGCRKTIVADYNLSAVTTHRGGDAGVAFVVADAARLPFRDGTFTKIFSYGLFPNIGSPAVARRMIDDWHALLAPSGTLYIGDIPDRARLPRILFEGVRRCRSVLGAKYLVAVLLNSYFSKRALRRRVTALGYVVAIIAQSSARRFARERFDLRARRAPERGRS
jgi:hypothetical protein